MTGCLTQSARPVTKRAENSLGTPRKQRGPCCTSSPAIRLRLTCCLEAMRSIWYDKNGRRLPKKSISGRPLPARRMADAARRMAMPRSQTPPTSGHSTNKPVLHHPAPEHAGPLFLIRNAVCQASAMDALGKQVDLGRRPCIAQSPRKHHAVLGADLLVIQALEEEYRR